MLGGTKAKLLGGLGDGSLGSAERIPGGLQAEKSMIFPGRHARLFSKENGKMGFAATGDDCQLRHRNAGPEVGLHVIDRLFHGNGIDRNIGTGGLSPLVSEAELDHENQ